MICIQAHLNNVFDRLAQGSLVPTLVMGSATPEREAEIADLQQMFPSTTILRESRAYVGIMRELDGQQTTSRDLYILVGTHGLATEAFLQSRLEGYKRGSVVLITDEARTIVTDGTSRLGSFQNASRNTVDRRILPITMMEVAALLSNTAQKGPRPNPPPIASRTSDIRAASGGTQGLVP